MLQQINNSAKGMLMQTLKRIYDAIYQHFPSWLTFWLNRYITNRLSSTTNARPNSHSLWSPKKSESPSQYLTWHSITDKQYFDLHMRPVNKSYIDSLPSNAVSDEFKFGEVTNLFARGTNMKEGRSSVFFMFFAQWFTDGFFRSNFHDGRKTTTTHNIDLAQIYGMNEDISKLLRSGINGQLSSQFINGEEYPDSLGELDENQEWKVKEKYEGLPYIQDKEVKAKVIDVVPKSQKSNLFATGLDRGNAILGNLCFSTLFLREHNNICKALAKEYTDWDDDRLFHTARIINTVVLMKLVIEDYVNHIAGIKVLKLDASFAEKETWYRTPWISAEFNLLYRWHSLIPNYLDYKGREERLVANYSLLKEVGLADIFEAASLQKAGEIGLNNVPFFMLPNEQIMIQKGRDWCLPPFNEYRKKFGMKPLTSFAEFSDDIQLQSQLKALYKDPDKVELTVGLFAEKGNGVTLTGSLLTTMVAYDAVTQIYTNPLLAKRNYTKQHFTSLGMKWIDETKTFQDLISRNMSKSIKVTLDL